MSLCAKSSARGRPGRLLCEPGAGPESSPVQEASDRSSAGRALSGNCRFPAKAATPDVRHLLPLPYRLNVYAAKVPDRLVTCGDCGEPLPDHHADPGERPPCPRCGGATISVAIAVHDTATVTDRASWSARTTNAGAARTRQLETALGRVEVAVASNDVGAVQDSLKQALEAVHELTDCLTRGEWSQDGWTPDDRGLWIAHLGARNAMHHTSSALVVLHSDGTPDQRLMWERSIDVRSAQQKAEYSARLSGRAVLPTLRWLVRRVSDAVA